MRVVSLPGDPGVGPKLASYLGLEHISLFSKRFPDGEIYVRLLQKIENEEILLVQSMYPAQNDRLVELLLALELLNRYENRVSLLVTYLAYARQDKEFLGGEPVSLRSIIRAMIAQGVKTLVTIDAHNPHAVKEFLSNVKYVNLLPEEVFAEALSERYRGREMTVVAPDQGATDRALSLAKHLRCGYVVIQKVRDRVTGQVKHVLDPLSRVSGLAVIVDDIISTGGTIAGIASCLANSGVEVVVAASHALLVGEAFEKLVKSGVREIYALPTISPTLNNVIYLDIVPYIARELKSEGVI
ncbi:MAG: ribose-phosphate diphosphokinase [Sulfolobales archaeon]